MALDKMSGTPIPRQRLAEAGYKDPRLHDLYDGYREGKLSVIETDELQRRHESAARAVKDFDHRQAISALRAELEADSVEHTKTLRLLDAERTKNAELQAELRNCPVCGDEWETSDIDGTVFCRCTEQISDLRAELEAVKDERDSCKQQAQTHSREARTQTATVNEIYQIVTGGKGEPGDWNGAEPVRKAFAELQARIDAADSGLADMPNVKWATEIRHYLNGGTGPYRPDNQEDD